MSPKLREKDGADGKLQKKVVVVEEEEEEEEKDGVNDKGQKKVLLLLLVVVVVVMEEEEEGEKDGALISCTWSAKFRQRVSASAQHDGLLRTPLCMYALRSN